jgi:hypothetical protein
VSIEGGTAAWFENLLRQQVRPTEILDCVFSAGPTLTIAITSERLLVAGPSYSNGWALKAIPWRLITEIEPMPSDGQPPEGQVVRVRYEVTVKKPAAWQMSRGPSLDENVDNQPPGELVLVLPSDGGRTAQLLRARISPVQPS